MKCSKTDCKNKNTMNCLICKHNENLTKKEKMLSAYNNKYKTF